jgi:hypothetical protein
MKFLRSHQIAAEIINLIESTQRHCYLVTPYISRWDNLNRTFEKAAAAGTRISVFLRDEAKNRTAAKSLADAYGFEVYLIRDLHTKLYVNESRAIIGSMNLYDASQKRNFELAAVVTNSSDAKRIVAEIVHGDLLAVTPSAHIPGGFSNAVLAERERLEGLQTKFASQGFCVQCGESIDLEPKANPTIVRCRKCYFSRPDSNPAKTLTKRCHKCGEPYDGTLASPLHPVCRDEIREYRDLQASLGPTG